MHRQITFLIAFVFTATAFGGEAPSAHEILDQVRALAGAKIAVMGDGKLGLLIAQVLRARGARVHLFGMIEEHFESQLK